MTKKLRNYSRSSIGIWVRQLNNFTPGIFTRFDISFILNQSQKRYRSQLISNLLRNTDNKYRYPPGKQILCQGIQKFLSCIDKKNIKKAATSGWQKRYIPVTKRNMLLQWSRVAVPSLPTRIRILKTDPKILQNKTK